MHPSIVFEMGSIFWLEFHVGFLQYRHDQSRLSTGHGIGAQFKKNTVTEIYWLIYAAATVIFSVNELI